MEEAIESLHVSSLQFTTLLPNWVYLIFQEAQVGRKADIVTCTILKISLWELKKLTCPKSTSPLGWGENPVLLILNPVFSGFKVLKPLEMDNASVVILYL